MIGALVDKKETLSTLSYHCIFEHDTWSVESAIRKSSLPVYGDKSDDSRRVR